MVRVGIIYFSGYGHTKKQAEAVRHGAAAAPNTEVQLFEIAKDGELPQAAWDAFPSLDAMVYGSPTYMGGPAWQFKKFADESSKPWFGQAWKDKIAGGFTNSASVNGDKANTIQYMFTLAQQQGQIWVGTGLLPANRKENGPDDVNWTAGFAGALAIAPSDASPDEAPRAGDLETARLYGRRIAIMAARLKNP